MNDLLSQILSQTNEHQIADQLGMSPEQTKQGLEALLPALTGAAQHKVRQQGGLGTLVEAISHGGFEDFLGRKPDPTVTEAGNQILGDLLGNKDTSREVATQAGRQTGIDPSLLKKLLPIAATLLMGYFAKKGKEAHAAPAPSSPAPQTGGGGGLSDILGGLLDKDGDGSFLDDVMGGALGGLLGGRK